MKRKLSFGAAALSLFVCGLLTPAPYAQAGDSVYSKIDIEGKCRPGRAYEEGQGAEWWCPGLNGVELLVAEGDLRFFIGYGPNAAQQVSFGQTLGPFNTIGKTLEWRVKSSGGVQVPYATILRYHTEVNGYKGQILVVTKVTKNHACHVAYVDARANADANVLAREAADTIAPGFDCASGKAFTIGKKGKSLY